MKRVFFYLSAAAMVFSIETLQAQSTTPTSDPGVTVNDIIWATRNVDTAGKFVDDPEDFGNFFSFEEAQTACPEGWRTPVMDEFWGLIHNPSISEWTTVNGVAGRRFGSGDNSFFLPAAGGCNKEADKYDIRAQGIMGYYWSSTVPDSSEYNGRYKSSGMWFGDGVDYNRFMQGNNTRHCNLRCVRK